MQNHTPVAVWDLDGTLVDSAPGLLAAVNRRLAERGAAPLDRPAILPMIGDGAAVLLERAFAARGLDGARASLPALLADLEADPAAGATPFAGIPEAIGALSGFGWRHAVCTNKPEAAARGMLAALGLAPHLAALVGGDTLPERKPDPAPLRAAISRAGGDPALAVMLGDHRNDVLAAEAAGVAVLFCDWGYGTAPAGVARVAEPAALPARLRAAFGPG